ncbi:hypothetical protein GQ53DRAFT_651430, partial [Thozetella sp. PMI_491]
PSVPINTRTTVRNTLLSTGGGPDQKSPILVPKGTSVGYGDTLHLVAAYELVLGVSTDKATLFIKRLTI